MAAAATLLGALLAVTWAPADALAHHATGGQMVTTFGQGLLSGLAHPVIGLDHLAFLLAIGTAAAFVTGGWRVCVAFVAASTAGVAIHLAKVDVPIVEPLVALSVIAAGALLLLNTARTLPLVLALAAVAGLFHGYAFGESIVGAEPAPLGAYLLGLAIIACAIVLAAMKNAQLLAASNWLVAERLRWAGGLFCVAGVYFLYAAVAGA